MLHALIRERCEAKRRASVARARGDDEHADCLDARQLSLKLIANAIYCYTGTDVSSLEGKPLAEACVRWGNFYCREAIRLVHAEAGAGGSFAGGRVVYAQTDSCFVELSGRSPAQAVAEGKAMAAFVSDRFPAPLNLEFEKVLHPFLLLRVNRYAGAAYVTEERGEQPTLLVKGVGVERGSNEFSKSAIRGALAELLRVSRRFCFYSAFSSDGAFYGSSSRR